MAPTLIHESFFAQAVNFLSGHRLFAYDEERPDYVLPARYRRRDGDDASPASSQRTLVEPRGDPELMTPPEKAGKGGKGDAERGRQCLVVDFDEGDLHDPQNWSRWKKCLVTAEIALLTFAIYVGSAIYSPGYEGVEAEFGVSLPVAVLGLSLFVAGYGVAPMLFGPISEIPQIGRMQVYIWTLAIFVVLQVPTALAPNLGSLLVLRFLGGLFGGPVLGTGGASISDMWSKDVRALPIAFWGFSAVCGPSLGPLLTGFTVPVKGWRWTIWELLWMSGAALVFLVFLLPETSAANILTRRARRLRRLTGNDQLRAQAEIDAEGMTVKDVAFEALARPFILAFGEPICFFCNLYIGLSYALLFVFVESFVTVFQGVYGFNLGQVGLAFLSINVFTILTLGGIAWWTFRVYAPALHREGDDLLPEIRMQLAMFGSVWLPISLFWYGWSARESIHWICPMIGAGTFAVGLFSLFQSILNYLGDCYPKYAASAFASNDFIRSMFGAGFPIFATAMYMNLGIAGASSLLGGLGLAFVPLPFLLYRYGPQLRRWSRYAEGPQPKR